MNFLKNNWSNLLFILLIILLILPSTRKPIQVTINRLVAVSPTKISNENRTVISNYDWKLEGLKEGAVNLTDARGKVAIINLWATWCPPCIAEMPSFQELYKDYKQKVNFYFISFEEEKILHRFMAKKEYDLPVYRPLSKAPQELMSNSLPTTFLISKSGEIVVAKKGAANWNDKNFRNLLEELIKEEFK